MRIITAVLALLGLSTICAGFHVPTHRQITEISLRSVLSRFPAVRISPLALTEVLNANECTDVGPEMFRENTADPCLPTSPVPVVTFGFYEQQGAAKHHFDDEQIADGIAYIEAIRQTALLEAANGRYALVRKLIGAATHAIQDFYSHTNWVELHLPNGALFQDASGHLQFTFGDRNLRIANETENVCSSELRMNAKTGETYEAKSSDTLLAIASNGGTVLTSGYFFNKALPSLTIAKCTHGFAYPGIAKDTPDSRHGAMVDDRGSSFHNIARDLAARHTEQWLTRLVTDLAKNEDALKGVFSLFAVTANKMNKVPFPVLKGEVYKFNTPPNQTIVWGYEGFLGAIIGNGKAYRAGPDGVERSDLMRTGIVPPPIPDKGIGALIGCILLAEQCNPPCPPAYVFIGSGSEVEMPASGILYLTVNDGYIDNNDGHFLTEFTLVRKAR